MARVPLEIVSPVEDPGPWSSYLYSIAGGGKTTLAASCPRSVMIDIEGSRRSLLNHPELYDVPCIPAPTYDHVLTALDMHCEGKLAGVVKSDLPELEARMRKRVENVETFIIDTTSTLQKKMMRAKMKAIKKAKSERDEFKPSENEYDIINNMMRDLVLQFQERSKCNLILVCHVREEKDSDGNVTLIRPGNSPRLAEDITALMDCVLWMDSKTDTKGISTRRMISMPSNKIVAKNRFSATLSREILNPTWDDVEKAIKEQQENALKALTERQY